jgi:hypothetical protein
MIIARVDQSPLTQCSSRLRLLDRRDWLSVKLGIVTRCGECFHAPEGTIVLNRILYYVPSQHPRNFRTPSVLIHDIRIHERLEEDDAEEEEQQEKGRV